MVQNKDREHRKNSNSSPEIAKSTKSSPQSINRNAVDTTYLVSFPELNPNPIIELDFEGHLSYLNPAARKLLPDIEILGGKHPFLVDWSKFVQAFKQAKQSEVISREINFGNLIYEQAITLLPQNKIRVYAQDITLRKRAEEALMESETYLRATLNSTEDGILVVDNHQTIITANDHFLEMFRIPRDLVIQKDDNPVLALVVGQMINPESFLNKVKQLYGSEIIDRDTLHLKDGRVIERYSEPLILQEKIAGRVWSFRDNTELILAEEGLKRSEEKYRLIVEKSTDIIFSFNFAGEFLYISPSIKNLLGYDPDDLIGHPFQSLVHPEDITGLQQAIQRNINDGSQAPGGNRFRVRNASGEWRWHSTTGNAVYDDNGKFAYFIAISRDITEHKKAEELLQATEQNFRNSLDGSPMGIRIIDSERRSLYVNQEFLNIFGYKNIGEVGDYPLQAHYTPEEHLKFLSRQEKRNHGKQIPENIRVEIKSKDGIIRYLEVSDSEVVWNGKPHREIIYEDVTESELAKKALQESEEKYKLIVENSTDIIFTLDIAGRFIYLSPSIKNVLGYAPLELIGVPFHSLVHPDDMHVIDEAELLHHEPGVKFFKREEYRFRDASGQWRWLSSTGTPMREGYEKTFNFVGVARDITQQKKSEEALIASEVNYRRLFESSKDGILIINAVTGLITDVNPYLVDLLGFAPKEFMVVLGNPPYSGASANKGKWARELVQRYYQVDGAPLGEKNPKWLQDDYVKFLAFGQWRIEQTGSGVLGFITNHSYLDNPTFRGMRQSLMNTFTDIYIFNLHGNSKKKEVSPDGGKDENVFDIQQGVTIGIFIKEIGKTSPATIHYADLWGKREGKYLVLAETDISLTKWIELEPTSPYYLLVPQDTNLLPEYQNGWKVTDIFPVNVLGFQTHRDEFAIDFEEKEVRSRIINLRDSTYSDEELIDLYGLRDNNNWQLSIVRKQLKDDIKWEQYFTQCLYRPFDLRYCYFNKTIIDRPRRQLIHNVFQRNNLCILLPRQIAIDNWGHVGISNLVAESCAISTNTTEQNYIFPLYLYPAEGEMQLGGKRQPNLNSEFIKAFSGKLGMKFIEDGKGNLLETFGPEDIFDYAYAIFHSPAYRSRYAEFLKIDFPRLPLTSDKVLFRSLVEKGGVLVSLHLMESPLLNNIITKYEVKGEHLVEKVSYDEKTLRVSINKTQYFEGVPPAVWNFHIGGYQVCEKWLKDRKGRKLTIDDIAYYQKIVVALKETIRLMQEIDAAIAEHGGWPVAFD